MAKQAIPNDTTKRAALSLFARGLITQSEAAALAGTTRQLMRYWAKDIPDARPDYLRKLWQSALKQGSRRKTT